MATNVYLETEALRELSRQIRSAQEAFASIESVRSDKLGPVVTFAYGHFCDRWDEKRHKLADSLTDLADTLNLLVDSFERTDESLAQSASDGGGPGDRP